MTILAVLALAGCMTPEDARALHNFFTDPPAYPTPTYTPMQWYQPAAPQKAVVCTQIGNNLVCS